MNERWSIRDYLSIEPIPELAKMSKKERKAIWLRGYLKALRNWKTWVVIVVSGFCLGLASGLVEIWVPEAITTGISFGIFFFIVMHFVIKLARRYIRKNLDGREQVSNT